MNILQLQDRLKDLSDQQLAREMQNPSGGAPQYLVLTELQRRKKMRDSMPQQQPQQSMAEEAVAGVASLPPPAGMEDVAESAAETDRMYRGGVVRMAGGGDVSSMSVDELRRLLDDLSDPRFRSRAAIPDVSPDTVRAALAEKMDAEDAGYRSAPRTRFSRDINSAANAVAGAAGAVGQGIADVGSGVAGAVGAAGRGVADYFTQPTLTSNEGVPPVVDVSPTPRDYDYQNPGPSDPSIPTPPTWQTEAQARAQSRGGVGGSGGGGGGIASTGVPNPAAPSPAQQEEASYIAELRKELAASKDESAKERDQAKSMALIEAGLRMAGSQSPHFGAALAEAAPAVQSYTKANSDIRRNERENRQLQIALEREATMDKYRSAQERRMDEQTRLAEKGLDIQRAAIGASRGRDPVNDLSRKWDWFKGLSPEDQEKIGPMMGLSAKTREALSPNEVLKALTERLKDPMLSKEEREAINGQLRMMMPMGGASSSMPVYDPSSRSIPALSGRN